MNFSDLAPPIFALEPEDLSINCLDDIPEFVPFVHDMCSEFDLEFSEDAGGMGCEDESYEVTQTWTATDACGNANTVSRVITVNPFGVRFMEIPENKSVSCIEDAIFDEAPVAETSCGELMEITYEDLIEGADCEIDLTHIRVWTVTNTCGNTAQAQQNIYIIPDELAPTFVSIPFQDTIYCATEEDFIKPVFVDNCSPEVVLTKRDSMLSDDCSEYYQLRRVWYAEDDCFNKDSITVFYIVEKDDTPPIFEKEIENQTISCTEDIVFERPQALDYCSESFLTYTDEIVEGDCEGEFTTTRTWTATDFCGNASTISQTITVTDNEAPIFTIAPHDQLMTCDQLFENGLEDAEAFDYCGEIDLIIEEEKTQGDCSTGFNIIRTWTAIDACGNVTVIDQVVQILPVVFEGLTPEETNTKLKDATGHMLIRGVDQLTKSNIKLFPNPVSDRLNIEFAANNAQSTTIEIFDVNGKLMMTSKEDIQEGQNNIQVNIGNMLTGTYMMVIQLDDQQYIERFIKM